MSLNKREETQMELLYLLLILKLHVKEVLLMPLVLDSLKLLLSYSFMCLYIVGSSYSILFFFYKAFMLCTEWVG